MYLQDNEKAQVIMMFSRKGIVKELLYPEFETLLENYLPSPEWAGKTVPAVYLEVNSRFCVTSAVFFLLGFTDQGMVESSWNMPLGDLARTTFKGPNLGAGAIHIATASQCPIAFYQDHLWDPEGDANSGHYALLKRAVKSNKLGILFKSSDSGPIDVPEEVESTLDVDHIEHKIGQRLSQEYEAQMRDQLAHLLEDQRQRITELKKEHDRMVRSICDDYEKQVSKLSGACAQAQAAVQTEQGRSRELAQTLEGQMQKIEGLREYYEHKLQRAGKNDEESLGKALENITTDDEVGVATQELSDLLQMKELELQYRQDHESQLREELRGLRDDYDALQENAGPKLLESLSQKGVNFVTYQPGAGHITIPVTEIESFLENPMMFTASFLGVSESHYQAWLAHFQAPVCKALDDKQEMCCKGVDRIALPSDFVVGKSDFCDKHRTA